MRPIRNGDVEIRTDFPTGNGLVRVLGDQSYSIDRELRDSEGARWYWHVMLISRASRDVSICMAREGLLGRFGPSISTNGGPYAWMSSTGVTSDQLSLRLSSRAETLICSTIPYGPLELSAFQSASDRPGSALSWQTLALSEAGRMVPILRRSAPDTKALIVFTARHHACEAMGSFVLEGAVLEFIQLLERGHPLAMQMDLVAVPLIDIDGVYHGDQGKGRLPWDHGRDYGSSSRYRSVAALRELIAQDTRPIFAMDFHTPGLRGPMEEQPYVVASGDEGDEELALGHLSRVRERLRSQQVYPGYLRFDEEWNSCASPSLRCCTAWLRSRANTRLAVILEYPNAVVGGAPVLPSNARDFGAANLHSLLEFARTAL